MILAALLAFAQAPACPVSDHWTVISFGGGLPWIDEGGWDNVAFNEGKVYWNGSPVSDAELRTLAQRSGSLLIRGFGADCMVVQRYAAMLETATACSAAEGCVVSFDPYAPDSPPPPPPRTRHRRRF